MDKPVSAPNNEPAAEMASLDLGADLRRAQGVLGALASGDPAVLAELRELLVEALTPGLALAALADDPGRLMAGLHALKGTSATAGLVGFSARVASFEACQAGLSAGARAAWCAQIVEWTADVIASLRRPA